MYGAFVLLVCLLASCDRECLCHLDSGSSRAKAEVDVDWSRFDKEDVSGMTALCYSDDSDSKPHRFLTNDVSKAHFLLPEDFYDILVISHSEGEYGSLKFSGMDSYKDAKAEAVAYKGQHWLGDEARVIAEPDWLAVGRMEDAVVSWDMIAESAGVPCGCSNCCCETLHTGKSFSLGTIFPQSAVYSFDVSVRISGLHNLKSVRASISGLADSHNLSSGTNGASSASQLLLSWKTLRESSESGRIESSIRTFGLPRDPAPMMFDLQIMLVDGKTIVRNSIDVSDLVAIDESGMSISLELALTEPLPESKPSSGGGFEATVNGWSEAGDIEIIL